MNTVRHWKTIVGLLAVFVAGAVIGGALAAVAIQHKLRERMNSDNWAPRTMAWFHDSLHTSPDQQSQLRPMVDRSVEQMRSLRDDAEQHWRAIMAELVTEAAPVLTEEQRIELRELIERGKQKPGWISPGNEK